MADIAFYEIVGVRASDATIALGVANLQGIVVGMSGEQGKMSYAVLIGEKTYIVDGLDLSPTGECVDRSVVYGGEVIRVEPERYDDHDSQS